MTKFDVFGLVGCSIRITIDLSDEEIEGLDDDEIRDIAFEKADDEFGGISGYVGNGGTEKLIGVCGSNEGIEHGDGIDWTDCYEKTD